MKRLILAFAALFFLIAVIGIRANPDLIHFFTVDFFVSFSLFCWFTYLFIANKNKDR